MTNIKTLDQFAELINTADTFKTEFYEIIEANGWQDLTASEFDICSDGKSLLYFNEQGEAAVKSDYAG